MLYTLETMPKQFVSFAPPAAGSWADDDVQGLPALIGGSVFAQIQVQVEGQTKMVDVTSLTTGAKLKRDLCERLPPGLVVGGLYYGSRPIADDRTLVSYGVRNGSVVEVKARLRGGVGEAIRLPSVGDVFEIDVEGAGWAPFGVFEVSTDVIRLVKCDEPDFFEKLDIAPNSEEGAALTLPPDFRQLPDGATAPDENGTVVWAWSFLHLKSAERLRVNELRLPGPGGSYTIFEERMASMNSISWLKRVRTPNGGVIKSLPKLAKHLFSNQLLAIATDSLGTPPATPEGNRSDDSAADSTGSSPPLQEMPSALASPPTAPKPALPMAAAPAAAPPARSSAN
mmetsp:Transcript_33107/g.97504  ORF Transcript_33107/g.97504 Transcript_33107/m.97504 type:complete len:340 (+) Transcript_33107:202-1221(+)